MSNFKEFKRGLSDAFSEMTSGNNKLFLTGVGRDSLWETYLNSFPEGTNEVYKERQEFDCNSCKQFIRPYGNVVSIVGNKLVSIWDIEGLEYPFNVVAKKMSEFVKSQPIVNVFVVKENSLGVDKNIQLLESGETCTWEHFYFRLPRTYVDRSSKSIESVQGGLRDSKNVFKRAMEEITLEAGETILELIEQGSLYRGFENKKAVQGFVTLKKEYQNLPDEEKDNWAWKTSFNNPQISRVRNSAIGTLLVDLSNEVDLDIAVSKFEKRVAPSNYKRPKAIFTKKMVEQAESKMKELGLENSLHRRYAVLDDITVNNVLFVNRDAKKVIGGSVFDDLKEDVSVKPKNFSKVEEVKVEDFVKNILPKASNIELLVENKHQDNLVSLIAPEDKEAPSMLKWNNNFSWSYNGDIADSMKDRVKQLGGKVDGVLRYSIQWNEQGNNNIDFDAHCLEPKGFHINYRNKVNLVTKGNLDVDIIDPDGVVAVENITWPTLSKMEDGTYQFWVNNYSSRESKGGFTAEIEFNGEVHSFEYSNDLKGGENIRVANVILKEGIFSIKPILDSSQSSKEVWGVKTNKFVKASTICLSPNYWDEQKGTGNKHYFFFLEGCKNPESTRGFYNEFLNESLMEHKRVFEALGSKMKVAESDNQLSGLGFSTTKKNDIVVKVEGSFTRTIKLIF